MNRIVLLFILLLLRPVVYGQGNFQEYKRAYNQAVQLYANSQYEKAVNAFVPLTNPKFNNPIVPYSHYYLALCSNNVTNFYQARTTLRQLFERYPDWDKMDEAYYLYAEANLNEKYYEEALNYINRIQDKSALKNVPDMTYKYLSQVKDVSTLKNLHQKFPNNKTVAEVLVAAIKQKPYATRDELKLSDELTNRFGLISSKKQEVGFARSYDDQTVDFGVLLPFKLGEVANASSPEKTYAYDLFVGLRMASELLQNEGIPTNIFAFDISNESEKMMQLIDNKNFKRIDLFVGPLYPKSNEVALSYARKHKIIQVHPLSNNSELTEEHSGIFLAQPCFEDQSRKALKHAASMSPKKTVAIYFGGSRKDAIFAETYRDQAEKEGFTVVDYRKIISNEDISNHAATNHVFLAAMPTEIADMVRYVRQEKNPAPIFTPAASIDFGSISKSILADELYLIYPEYVDKESEQATTFRDLYITKMGEPPTYYAYLGYDIGLYFARALKNGKDEFRQQLNLIEYTEGYTLSGFDYTNNKNSNQLIPIIKYENGGFREVTR